MSVVGKDIPHDSAVGHVTGKSCYIDDLSSAKGELVVDLYWSPVAHGRIKLLDLDRARMVPGVVGLYTYKDIAGTNKFGPISDDEHLLAENLVEFIGQPIVIIAAESKQAIQAAKQAITIEIEELEPVLSIDAAKMRKQFIGETRVFKRGDIAKAFAQAEHVLEGIFVSEGQDHFYLESQAAVAVPGEFDSLTVYSSTQNPTEVQEVIAQVLGLKQNQVVVATRRLGGGFGGKESQAAHPAAAAALVALATGAAARIVYSKDDDMQITGGRHPFQNNYKVAFNQEGVITALKVDFYADGGAANDLSTAIMGRAMTHAENAYYVHNIEITGTVCKTNFPPNTAFRGFGAPQAVANMENIIEEIALYLHKDALEIRKLNLYGTAERNVTPYGQVFVNNKLPEILDRLVFDSAYKSRLNSVRDFNARSQTHLKGISITPVKFGISFTTKFLNQANALVLVYKDGSVAVSTGAIEMGQGVNTKIQQLVADVFSIDPCNVRVMVTSTEKSNNTSPTAASSGSDLNGSAAVNAALKIRERLSDVAVSCLVSGESNLSPSRANIVFDDGCVYDTCQPGRKLSFKELVHLAYRQRANLGERGFYATGGIDFNWETGTGNPFLYYTTGWAVSEVLIDRFTGEVKVERADMLMDIGKPINPGIDKGQMTGAFVQCIGWVTTEKLVHSASGELLSHSPTTYKIPNIQDVPEIFNVGYIENDDNAVNIKGSKAVGEPPFLLGISVWTAIKHALSFVSNGDIPKLKLPATNEEIVLQIACYRQQQEKVMKTALPFT